MKIKTNVKLLLVIVLHLFSNPIVVSSTTNIKLSTYNFVRQEVASPVNQVYPDLGLHSNNEKSKAAWL